MSYTPTEWKSGDVVTSAKLNKLEQGIVDASSGGGGLVVIPFSTLGIPKVDETETTEVTLGDVPFTSCYLYDGDLGDLGTVNAPKIIMIAYDEDTPPTAMVIGNYQWETFPAADPTKVNTGTLYNTAETQAILLTPDDMPWALIPANTALAEGTNG